MKGLERRKDQQCIELSSNQNVLLISMRHSGRVVANYKEAY